MAVATCARLWLLALGAIAVALGDAPCYDVGLEAAIAARGWYARTCWHRHGSGMLNFSTVFQSVNNDSYYVEVQVGNGTAVDSFGNRTSVEDGGPWRALGKSAVFSGDGAEHHFYDTSLSPLSGARSERPVATRLRWHCVKPGSGHECKIRVQSLKGGGDAPPDQPRIGPNRHVRPSADHGGPARPARSAVALAFEGGGFRALATYMGLTAGALAVMGRARGQSAPTLSGSGLFGRFDTIASVSGGSWFAAEMAYSDRVVSLLESMAAAPESAGAQFAEHWSAKWLGAVGPPQLHPVKLLEPVVALAGLQGMWQTIEEVGYFLNHNRSWGSFVGVLLNSTAGIGPDLELGAPVSAWAEGKTWLAGHSLVTPSGSERATLWESLPGLDAVTYAIGHNSSGEAVPEFIPAAFSAVLGAGVDAPAPFPYTWCGEDLEKDALWYTGKLYLGRLQLTRPSAGLGGFRGLVEDAGRLPLADVVSASSAFLGGIAVTGYLNMLNEVLGLRTHPMPFVSSARQGAAFRVAEAAVGRVESAAYGLSRAALNEIADKQVRGVIDGAYTDNTGIAHAVAAGATEVVALLNGRTGEEYEWFLGLFQGGKVEERELGVPILHFPVFNESVGEAREQLSGFQRLVLPNGTQHLGGFSMGSLQLTTARSRWFGVAAGRSITVHAALIGSSTDMGTTTGLDRFNALVQEIVDCVRLPANADSVSDGLLAWLASPAAEGASRRRRRGVGAKATRAMLDLTS